MATNKAVLESLYAEWRADWNKFAFDVLGARLDKEQQAIISSVQFNPRTAVASGTARGKDFVTACACMCFMYLTPKFDENGRLIENTKIAMTAPTGRQVENIMKPEIRRLYRASGGLLPGRLVASDIRTDYEEWFMTGFKAGDNNTEAWAGFHAVNVMFAVTEATGISQTTFDAIEGNLQGNSRLLIVFNPNVTTGYAANAMKSPRFKKFRLNSLKAENVVKKKTIIPGQVDYEWVKDKVQSWTTRINEEDFNEGEGDFKWEGGLYRPNDLFRVKVLGMFPKVADGVLIPYEWIELANKRWEEMQEQGIQPKVWNLRLGADVAGMGRDSSLLCYRYDNYVQKFQAHQSAGKADHMHVVGMIKNALGSPRSESKAFIDTIGEGAAVLSRLQELGYNNAISFKSSYGAKGLKDTTGQYEFANMRAYAYWCVRDWLDPQNKNEPALPPCDQFAEEATNTKWGFQSDGKIIIEPKEKIKERIKRSPDWFDSLAQTFYPDYGNSGGVTDEQILEDFR